MPDTWLYKASVDSASKSVSMNAMDWRIMWGGQDDRDTVTEHDAYQIVSWVRRCVEIRCNALAAIPAHYYRGKPQRDAQGQESSQPEVEWEYADLMPRILWMTEAALQLYGAAYWIRLQNPYGFEKGYRWLLPSTIKPQYDKRKGLTGFERRIPGTAEPEKYKPDELLHFWVPNLAAEIGPGKGWVGGVLTEAGIAKFMNEFASGFFERGAMPGTILSVEGNPPKSELDRLEVWWRRIISGVKRAWETVAVRATVTPIPIGNPPKDLAMPELLSAVRQQIAVAAGVPQTMLEDAANYATASEHHKAFYDETIAPEATAIQATLNEQVFGPQGLRVLLDYQSLDIFQKDENERGQALQYYTSSGVPVDLAMEILGVDLPNNMTYDELRARIDEDAERKRQQALEMAQAAGNEAERREEAGRWQRKALKGLDNGGADVEFVTDLFTPEEQTAIHDRLAMASTEEEVKGAFAPPFQGAPEWDEGYP